jgi:hypothetical protein
VCCKRERQKKNQVFPENGTKVRTIILSYLL